MTRLSLRNRVTLASLGVIAVGLAVLTLGATLLLDQRLNSDADAALRTRADAELATLFVHGRSVSVRESAHDTILDRSAWVYVGGHLLERPDASPRVQRAVDALARTPGAKRRDVGGSLRVLVRPVLSRNGSRRATLVVGVSLVPYHHSRDIGLAALLALDVAMLLGTAIVTRRAVGAALRPVADMTTRAADWSEHDLDRRFGLGPARDELTGLAATLDALLGRIGAGFRHEQRFSSEIAHELRTPLSGVRGEAELALRPGMPPSDLRGALRRILRSTDRMAGVIATLLSVARHDAEPGVLASDPVSAANEALDHFRSAARNRSLRLDIAAQDGIPRVATDRELVEQALRPLIDNAVRHARADVKLSLESDGAWVSMTVSDDGRGVAPGDVDRIFEPGSRGTKPLGEGVGLGLPLSRRLARAGGGDVHAEAAGRGGRFVLRLPAAD